MLNTPDSGNQTIKTIHYLPRVLQSWRLAALRLMEIVLFSNEMKRFFCRLFIPDLSNSLPAWGDENTHGISCDWVDMNNVCVCVSARACVRTRICSWTDPKHVNGFIHRLL